MSPQWRKSSRSTTGECVEVADNLPGRVLVRDTKEAGSGPVLAFTSASWRAFVAYARNR